MKKILTVILSLSLAAALAACSSNEGSSSAPASSSTAGASSSAGTTLSGKVSANGSTSMEKMVGALSEAFMAANPNVDVTYDPTGSGAGITAATEGIADIGLSSRALKDEEAQNLEGITVALDGIAIIVNKSNTVKDLTIEQIAQLATGEITNWKDVGGTDAPVVLVGREAGSGTRDGFETITNTKDKCNYVQELTATGAVISAVEANPNAFGYASISSVKDTVSMVTVGGVAASEATVLDGTYKIQRPFVFVHKKGETLRPEVQAFVDFALNKDNAEIIANAGAVPVTK